LDFIRLRLQKKFGKEFDLSRLHELAEIISGIESDYGKRTYNSESGTKGNYHFKDESLETAKTRLKNILKRSGKSLNIDRILKETDVRKLSDDEQKILFFAHLTEDDGSDERILRWLEGDKQAGYDIYLEDHYKGNAGKKTKDRAKRFFKL